jgi:Rrf2 family protein
MLSQKIRYTIRAIQHLADRWGQGVVSMAEIADVQNIPPKFLAVILSELSREGIIISHRGREGGYELAIAPIDIRYGDIVRIMRGSLALVPCASRFAYERCANCVEEKDCRLRSLLLRVRDQTAEILDSVTFADPIPLEPVDEGTQAL